MTATVPEHVQHALVNVELGAEIAVIALPDTYPDDGEPADVRLPPVFDQLESKLTHVVGQPTGSWANLCCIPKGRYGLRNGDHQNIDRHGDHDHRADGVEGCSDFVTLLGGVGDSVEKAGSNERVHQNIR